MFLKSLLIHVLIHDSCPKHYGLDPCHYFSTLGLSWDAMLKMANIELEKNIRY